MSDCDFHLIEQDPDEFCQQCNAQQLQDYIDHANDIYYNSDCPESGLSDYAYDCLVYWNNKLNKKNPPIGALPCHKNRHTRLPYAMPSLNKVKIGGHGLEQFLSGQEGQPIAYSVKLDGVSAMIVYHNGSPQECYLRGNGIYGSDVSYILPYIKLPKSQTQHLVVRGELIVSKTTYGQASRATSRNWVSGLLNRNSISEDLKKIEFIAYQVVNDNHLSDPTRRNVLEGFKLLEQEGFAVAEHGILENNLSAYVLQQYRSYITQYDYQIDGLVLSSVNDDLCQKRIAAHVTEINNPKHSVAFKINLTEQLRNTVITGIDWSITRHGKMVPVAEFKPVFIDGARIHRAFVYNAKTCVDKYQLGVGTKVQVTRSGGVIPVIVKVLETIGTPCLPATKYAWHWSGCDIVIDDPEQCPDVMARRYEHFFETMNIPGIREGMIKRFMENGLDTLDLMVNATQERFRTIRGIGPKKSEAFYRDIRKGLASSPVYRLMYASNQFPSGIGKNIIRQVTQHMDISTSCTVQKLLSLPGIGPVRAKKILEGIISFQKFIKDLNIDISYISYQPANINPKIKGMNFVLTGIDDEKLEDFILDNGGSVLSKVDDSVCCVIAGNIIVSSEKQSQAFKKGIKIYTETEFWTSLSN